MSDRREKKGYALKRERGLVPHQYSQGSESWKRGAFKNWPHGSYEKDQQLARADRELLALRHK